jgi:hypothetical protein
MEEDSGLSQSLYLSPDVDDLMAMTADQRRHGEELHPAETPRLNPRITLDDLSNELIIKIIRQLPGTLEIDMSILPSQYRPSFRLMRCSKRLHQLTEPILYSHFTEEEMGNRNALQLFLKRILTRRDLGALVKRFQGYAQVAQYRGPMNMSCFDKEDWVRIEERAHEISQSTNFMEAAGLVSAIRAGDWDAVTTLTLSLTPNIEDLYITNWSHTNLDFQTLIRFISQATLLQKEGDFSNPLSLSHLKSVRQEYGDTQGGMDLDTLLPLLSLPSVEHFRSRTMNDEKRALDEESEWMHRNTYFPHIKTLSLHDINTDSETMQQFLKRFSNLETLYYLHGYAGDEPFEPPRMMTALNKLKSCLQSLSIFDDHKTSMNNGSLLSWFPIGSFTDFQKLKRIEVSLELLTGLGGEDREIEGYKSRRDIVDALPFSIEELILGNCEHDENFDTQLPMLISQKLTHFPALRKIDCGWQRIECPDKPAELIKHPGIANGHPEMALKFLLDCETVSVEIVVKNFLPPPKYIHWTMPAEQTGIPQEYLGHSQLAFVTTAVPYPYEDYEMLCEEYGCDPETGRPPAGDTASNKKRRVE